MLGSVAWVIQPRRGLDVAGYNDHAFWAIYIADVVTFIGVSYGGAVISAVLRLTGASWRAPLSRIAEGMAVVTVLIGGAFIIPHLGRPERIWELVTRPTAYIYLTFADILPDAYVGETGPAVVFRELLLGHFAMWFWTFVVGTGLLPLLLVAIPRTRTTGGMVVAAAFVVPAMWLKRMLMVADPATYDRITHTFGAFHFTWISVSITLAGLAAIPLLLMLLFRAVPLLSIDEIEETGEPEPGDAKGREHERAGSSAGKPLMPTADQETEFGAAPATPVRRRAARRWPLRLAGATGLVALAAGVLALASPPPASAATMRPQRLGPAGHQADWHRCRQRAASRRDAHRCSRDTGRRCNRAVPRADDGVRPGWPAGAAGARRHRQERNSGANRSAGRHRDPAVCRQLCRRHESRAGIGDRRRQRHHGPLAVPAIVWHGLRGDRQSAGRRAPDGGRAAPAHHARAGRTCPPG